MSKIKDNGTLKDAHEFYKKNSAGTDLEYIEELYRKNSQGQLEKIFDAGWDTTVTSIPATLSNARAKPTSWEIQGKSKQGILPDGYTQLEYLETDGNSCINTNLMITGNESWECVFENAGSNNLSSPVLGTLNGGSSFMDKNNFSITYTTAISPGAYAVYLDGNNGDSQHSWNGGLLTDHTKQTIRYTGLNTAPTINGVAMTQLTPTTLIAITPTVGVRLFGRATTAGNGTFAQSGVRIYSFKGDTWNFIPAKNSSNVLGMYEAVSGQFFTNAGTGTFTAGPALPSPTSPVDVKGVGKKTENLFDMHYDVAYTGSYPNITTVAGGKSTEWLDTDQFGAYFYFVWNVNNLNSNCVLGLVYSNDKSEVLYRDGLVNAGTLPNINTDVALGGGNPYRINHTYKYVKFYILNWAYTNRLAVYVNNTSLFIPYGYRVPIIQANNCGMVDLGTLNWLKEKNHFYASTIIDSPIILSSQIANCYSQGYTPDNANNVYNDVTNLTIAITKTSITSTTNIRIKNDNYSTVTGFKSAMSGKYLYYQRTTDDTWTVPTITNIYIPATINSIYSGGVVDLGTLTWNYISPTTSAPHGYFVCYSVPQKAMYSTNQYLEGYTYNTTGSVDKSVWGSNSYSLVCITDFRYTNATDFKEAMSGKLLYYQRTSDSSWTAPIFDSIESNGTLTRNIGIKVLDGTESWSTYTYQSSPNAYYITVSDMIDTEASTSPSLFMNTHLQWASGIWASSDIGYAVSTMRRMFFRRNTTDTIDDWKAYLAAQYAAGTPVIIYYPLATATETSIQVPTISTVKGTNYLDIQTEVEPSSVSITYRKRTSA